MRIERSLQNVPPGRLTITSHSSSAENHILLTNQFSAKTEGKGHIEIYSVFPGIEVSYNRFLAFEIAFHHGASPAVLELFHCHSGRVGWNMPGGIAIYLGAGDMTAHSTACCANSAMMFPLGYAEGISISIDLQYMTKESPDILQEAGIDPKKIQAMFCSGKPATIPACPELNQIFSPLYSAKPDRRKPYLKLKTQELLLYLIDLQIVQSGQTQHFSQQTELIKEIHHQLTEHLSQRFTIEELAKQYFINTSTLKEVFKAVYGLPIATYMKEYRVQKAMELLRESDATIANIAAQVGYTSQGKFTKTFKDTAKILPSEYRKIYQPKFLHRS